MLAARHGLPLSATAGLLAAYPSPNGTATKYPHYRYVIVCLTTETIRKGRHDKNNRKKSSTLKNQSCRRREREHNS